MAIYSKKGALNTKEKNYVKALEEYISKQKQANPDFEMNPIRNFAELESAFEEYCIEDASYDDGDDDFDEPKSSQRTVSNEKPISTNNKSSDPFNREEPEVRDYVLENIKPDEPYDPNKTFEEPVDFEDSFFIPESEVLGDKLKDPSPSASKQSSQRQAPSNEPQEEAPRSEPINPAFDSMDSAKQRKKTKRFAKQIVGITVSLLEFGFVWFTSKDITEEKLLEYELDEGLDFDFILTLDDRQQVTIKQFFANQREIINQESKIDEEDQDDLIDALTEVLLEKGIAPTPMQELALVGLKIVGMQALKAFQISSANKAILAQLRVNKSEEVSHEEVDETPRQPTQEPRRTPPPAPTQSNSTAVQANEVEELEAEDVDYEPFKAIETRE